MSEPTPATPPEQVSIEQLRRDARDLHMAAWRFVHSTMRPEINAEHERLRAALDELATLRAWRERVTAILWQVADSPGTVAPETIAAARVVVSEEYQQEGEQ